MKNLIEKGKKSLVVLIGAALLAGALPVRSSAAAKEPRDPDGKGRVAIEYIGAKACRVAGSTTASKCTAAGSSGMLYSLCAFGTAAVAGKGVMAFDSASASGIASFDVADAFVSAYAIAPLVYGSGSGSIGFGPNILGCWVPIVPVRYESGFVMRLNDASLMGVAHVRPDTGVNP
jgi:hypothetical protein